MCDVTPETPVRKLRFSTLRALADLLDPQDGWRSVAMEIRRPGGEPRYSQLHIRRFEVALVQGKSPTMELLFDWGTSDCSVADLLEILRRLKLFFAAAVLEPESEIRHTHADRAKGADVQEPPAPADHLQVTRVVEDEAPHVQREALLGEADSSSGAEESDADGLRRFTQAELRAMTGAWDERPAADGGSLLGSGGFGIVFRGRMGDTLVAVKKLNSCDSGSAEELQTQFNQEIQTLRRLKHENLLRMVGFCSDGPLCLVFAFMPEGSLLERLACVCERPPLSWRSRSRISTGAARGLSYLHTHTHVHRDVKSANILLDAGLEAKLCDFGLTRASETHTLSTLVTGRIVGTTAYMAPEALRGEITHKSDVFSFGVVLLEILTGLPPVDENRDPKLLMELRDEVEDGDVCLQDLMDRRMQGWRMQEVQRVFDVASQCLCEKKNRRPAISEVLSELEDLHESLLSE